MIHRFATRLNVKLPYLLLSHPTSVASQLGLCMGWALAGVFD